MAARGCANSYITQQFLSKPDKMVLKMWFLEQGRIDAVTFIKLLKMELEYGRQLLLKTRRILNPDEL